MKKMGVIYGMIVMLLVLDSSCFASGNTQPTNEHNFVQTLQVTSPANWTIMYYMCGDVKNMSDWIDPLIENLTKIRSTSDMNIVVLNDGAELGDVQLFYINILGKKIQIAQQFGWPSEVDTSDANTLELFCIQMMKAFPAKYYCLIPIASGGTGWQLFCMHDSHGGDVGVSIPVFANMLHNIVRETHHDIDVIFTSCAMNMIEVAYEFSPSVNYIVGTQDCLSRQYLVQRFYESVGDLRNDTRMTPEQFTKKAPERLIPLSFYYEESYRGCLPLVNRVFNRLPFMGLHTVTYHDSTAVVNLSNIDHLASAVSNLSQFLMLNEQDMIMKKAVSGARSEVCTLGKCLTNNKLFRVINRRWNFECTASDRFIDMYDFVLLLKNNTQNDFLRTLCNDVMSSFNMTIPALKKVPEVHCHGLSIYFPSKRMNYNRFPLSGTLPCPYEGLLFSQDTYWDDFIKGYFGLS